MAPLARDVCLAWVLVGGPIAIAVPDALAQTAIAQPPVLTAFSINGGATFVAAADTTISLTHTVVGAPPKEYRASRRADFAGAPWLHYVARPTIRDWYDAAGEPCDPKRPSHRVVYYLQVRTSLGEELKVADGQRRLVPARVESNVLRASICAYPPQARARPGASALTPALRQGYSLPRPDDPP
jgi:hypothetical protein